MTQPPIGQPPSDQPLIGQTLIGQTLGRYRIESQIGTGGMGEVYLAIQPQIGSRVAIKVLTADSAQNNQVVERFFNEARAVNTIRHDNIINVLDLDRLPDGRPYIVMEYIEGVSLAQALEQRGALPLGSLTRVGAETLEALAAAHKNWIIHRDLKPDNILITRSGRTKILDFGIAKLMGDPAVPAITQTGLLLGTPHYMAPEQITAGEIDGRTDIYALGVILYEGATGQKPFDGQTLFELFNRHINDDPTPPCALRAELPQSYEAVILKALAKEPADRFGSAKEMHAHLMQAAGGLMPSLSASENLADELGTPGQTGPHGVATPGSMGQQRTAWVPQGQTGPPGKSSPGPPAQDAITVAEMALAHAAVDAQASAVPAATPRAMPPLATTFAEAAPAPPPAKRARLAIAAVVALLLAGGGVGLFVALRGTGRESSQPVATEPPRATPHQQPSASNPAAKPAAPAATPGKAAQPRRHEDRLLWLANRAKKKKLAAATPKAGNAATATTTSGAGVTISGNVKISGNVQIIGATQVPALRLAAPANTRRFDPVAFYPRALKLARRLQKDVRLTSIDVAGVRAKSGLADLALRSSYQAEYEFRSPSASKILDRTLPEDDRKEVPCIVMVTVEQSGIYVTRRTDSACKQRFVGAPQKRWSLAKAWALALERGEAGKIRVAKVMWDNDGWYLNFGSGAGSCTIKKSEM